MRHGDAFRKLGRTTPHRQALFRNMLISLVQQERIRTTLPKAKELKRLADRLITWGKKGTVPARRRARLFLPNRTALSKLFAELAPRYAGRSGGYTRLFHMGPREGDQAPMALIEYLPAASPKEADKKADKKRAKKKTPKSK